MLNLCNADWEPVLVDFFNGAHRDEAFMSLNDMGEVPVLEAGDLVLTQSSVILDYLADTFEQFDAASVPEHREILRWMFFDNHKLSGNFGPLRFLRFFKKTGETPVTEFLHARVMQALAIVDKRLQNQAFVLGERPTIADISLCGYLYFAEEASVPLDGFPNVVSWLARIQQLPNWQHPYDLMPGHPLPG